MRKGGWAIATAAIALVIMGCGGGDLSLRSDDTPVPGDFVTVTGDISDRSTFDALDDIVVIACVGLSTEITKPLEWNMCPSSESSAADADGNFEIARVEGGDLRVGFWISRSLTPDGMIQDGDSFAELDDPDDELRDVQAGETVSLSQVTVDFEQGATAVDIDVTSTPDPGASTPGS